MGAREVLKKSEMYFDILQYALIIYRRCVLELHVAHVTVELLLWPILYSCFCHFFLIIVPKTTDL